MEEGCVRVERRGKGCVRGPAEVGKEEEGLVVAGTEVADVWPVPPVSRRTQRRRGAGG